MGQQVTGPLDMFSGQHERAASVIGMFQSSAESLTPAEWEAVLESRRELISAKLGSIFTKKLGDVEPSGLSSLFSYGPAVAVGVLDRRGVFFQNAVAHREKPIRTIFAGINNSGGWLLVVMRSEYRPNAKPRACDWVTEVRVRDCKIGEVLRAGIDPLDLFRRMSNWMRELRNHRFELLMEAMKLEAQFAAQELHVKSKTTVDEYGNHRLTISPV